MGRRWGDRRYREREWEGEIGGGRRGREKVVIRMWDNEHACIYCYETL
jgi:hypothetical protein